MYVRISLLNDKFSDRFKLKAFADNKSNIVRMIISSIDRVENTVGKGENAGYQYFLLFLQCFPKPSSLGSELCGREINIFNLHVHEKYNS